MQRRHGHPTGYFSTPVDYSWRLLMGPSYGQYATRIYDSYLFHSVPYYSQHKDDVEYDEFNLLGTRASLGCIRLAVVDVKWIYDNCPLGTPVIIYNDADDPGPMGKPGTIYTDPADTEKRGWDPTDPDPANPWDDAFESGTAIRSQAAWDQWETERENWMSSLTPTDLQGWSTDSKIAGTRG
ncbi:L,D-transpeptidase [Gemmiger formicilis]|nr:L,D-transpeptidase [Gemmiger formicilis]